MATDVTCAPSQDDSNSMAAQEQTQALPVKPKHGVLYYLAVFCLLCTIVAGAVWLGYNSYVAYISWYTGSLHTAFNTGKSVGLAQGKQQGVALQRVQDARVLLQVKTADAHTLAHIKAVDVQAARVAYQRGQQDSVDAMQQWWTNHCRYDRVIAAYVCVSSP